MPERRTNIVDTWVEGQETPPPAPTVDRFQERYELRHELGRGGMGRVLLAWDTTLRREVAVKVMTAGRTGRERFLQEARIAARLEHPAIIPVHDAGETVDGEVFYVMRLVRGTHLGQAIAAAAGREGRLALLDAVIDVARGLAHAHATGVVHRDLKPDNVMLGPWGEVQLVDWGLARILEEAEPHVQALRTAPDSASVAGTPAYMSPEQARGEKADARSDVWALGLLLREVLTGDGPWDRDTAPEQVLRSVREGRVPPLPADLPPELAAIVARATAAAPDDRYPDATAFVGDLLAFRAGRRVAAHSYSAREELWRLERRFRWPLRFAATVFLGGAVALVGVGRESARARAAERGERTANTQLRSANDQLQGALAASLVDRASAASERGLGGPALAYATAALAARPHDPVARGLVGRWFRALPVAVDEVLGSVPGPCDRMLRAPDSEALWCAGSAGAWAWNGGLLWSDPTIVRVVATDGSGLVVERASGTGYVVDATTGADRFPLDHPPGAAAFAGDDLYVASRTALERRDAATGEVLATTRTTSQIGGLRVLPDEVVAWTAAAFVHRFGRDLGVRSVRTLEPRTSLYAIATSAADVGVVAHPSRGVSILDTRADTLRPVAGIGAFSGNVGISPGGTRAFVADHDAWRVLAPDTGVTLAWFGPGDSMPVLDDDGGVRTVLDRHLVRLTTTAAGPSANVGAGVGRLVAVADRVGVDASGGAVAVYDPASGVVVERRRVEGEVGPASTVWRAGRPRTATVTGSYEWSGEAWIPRGGPPTRRMTATERGRVELGIEEVRFVEDGAPELVVPVAAGFSEVSEGPEGGVVLTRSGDAPTFVDRSGARALLAPAPGARLVGVSPGGCWWWDAGELTLRDVDGAVRARVPFPRPPHRVVSVDDTTLAVMVGVEVHLVEQPSGELLARTGPFETRVADLVVAGDWLVTGHWDGELWRWWLPALRAEPQALLEEARTRSGLTVRDGQLAPWVAGP